MGSLNRRLSDHCERITTHLYRGRTIRLSISNPGPQLAVSPLTDLSRPSDLGQLDGVVDSLLPPISLARLLLRVGTRAKFTSRFFRTDRTDTEISSLPIDVDTILVTRTYGVNLRPLVESGIPTLAQRQLG